MATVAPPELERLGREVSAGRIKRRFPSAQLSGLVGDARHAASGGYHIGRDYQSASNYSVGQFAQDRRGDGRWASAFDMTLSAAEMRAATANLRRVFDDPGHPARRYLRGFNGSDGVGSADRFDIGKGIRSTASSDHLWHIHAEIYREFANDPQMVEAIVAAVVGTAPAQTEEFTVSASDVVQYELRPWLAEANQAVLRMEPILAGLAKTVDGLVAALKEAGGDLDTAAVLNRIDEVAKRESETVVALRAEISALSQRLSAAGEALK